MDVDGANSSSSVDRYIGVSIKVGAWIYYKRRSVQIIKLSFLIM